MKYILLTDRLKAVCAYKRGKLCAIEVKKGAFDFDLLAELVPTAETAIDPVLMRPDEGKPKNTFFAPANDEWNKFYTKRVGLDYRFTAADGKALASIGKYLYKVANDDADDALELWRHILNGWDKLEEFYRNNPDLKFINGQLNKIVYQLKHGKQGSSTAKRNDADDLRRSFAG